MKAKDKLLGQIIDVYPVEKNDKIYYREVGNEGEYFIPEENLDFDDIIDWEQRRYEIAKRLVEIQMMKPDSCNWGIGHGYTLADCNKIIAQSSVDLADALIKELKK